MSWDDIIEEWLEFWNKVRYDWFKTYGRLGFGASANNPRTRAWLKDKYYNEYLKLLEKVKKYFSGKKVYEVFNQLCELFAIQYGVHQKWYAERYGRGGKASIKAPKRANLARHLKYLITKHNYENGLNLSQVEVKIVWDFLKNKKVAGLLSDATTLFYEPSAINEGPILIRKWSFETFLQISPLIEKYTRREIMKKEFDLLTWQDFFKLRV